MRYKVTTHWGEEYTFEVGGPSDPLIVDGIHTPFQGADYCCNGIYSAMELYFSWAESGFEHCNNPRRVAELCELCDVEEVEEDDE